MAAACACHAGLAGLSLLHMVALAAGTEQRVLSRGLEPKELSERLSRHAFPQKLVPDSGATVVAAYESVAIVDSHSEILAHAIAAAREMTAGEVLYVVRWDLIIAVGALPAIVMHHACNFSGSSIQSIRHVLLLLPLRLRPHHGAYGRSLAADHAGRS